MKRTGVYQKSLALCGGVAWALATMSLPSAQAANVGNYDGSSRSWNSSEFSTIKSTAIAAGHTVEADEALTAANLANDTHLVIGEPGSTPTLTQLADLQSWVNGGGILLLMADSANSGLPALNQIAAGIGSSLNWSGSASSAGTFASGNFASEGPPFNLVGQSLDTTPGTAVVSGGASLAGDYIRYQQLGAGYVFGFADRSDHNTFNPNSTDVNGRLFLNILAGGGTPGVPDGGATAVLLALSVGTLLLPKVHGAVRR